MTIKLKISAYLSLSEVWSGVLQFIGFSCLLFGISLWLVNTYGNATPYWDQWDVEADGLYKPYFSGTLHWANLVAAHNEHHLFPTRLLALLLVSINKVWNPLLQMVINAGLHTLTLVYSVSLLAKPIGRNYFGALFFFSFILFAIPFGWENTLVGFQSSFYFLLLFTLISLRLIVMKEPLTIGWWMGVACAVMAYFTLASGAYTLGAGAMISLIIFFTNLRRTPRQLTAVTILFIMFYACTKLTPAVPAFASLKANSLKQFFDALKFIGGWPISHGFFSMLIRNFPSLLFFIIMLRKPSNPGNSKWVLLALVIWSLWQSCGLAYNRAAANSDSQYKDLFTFTILVNFASLIWVVQQSNIKWQIIYRIFAGAWIAIVIVSLVRWGYRELPGQLSAKRENSIAEEINTRNYLATGDTNHLKNKPILQIPYPDADRLAMILSWKEIRGILPGNLNPGLSPASIRNNSAEGFVKNGFYPSTPKFRDSAWGSYSMHADSAIGEISLTFDDSNTTGNIIIPVAGYPLSDGIKFEVEQKGKRIPIVVAANPKESWIMGEAKLDKGPFSIHASDSNKTTWFAFSNPAQTGKLDKLTYWALSHFYLAILMGILCIMLAIIKSGFENAISPGSQEG
jgi:hypothetical protein